MGGHGAIEVAKTVLEVADVAWTTMEHHHHSHEHDGIAQTKTKTNSDDELESLRSENGHLRTLLDQNLKLLQDFSESPFSLNDCPPGLYARLLATVDSEQFLARLKSLQQVSVNGTSREFRFKKTLGDDVRAAEVLIKVDNEEPSRWVWVTDEMVPNNVEEWSGIDNENYVVVSEQHVVDGVANFMARCIMSNPESQNLTPEELQKSGVNQLEKILGIRHAGKLFYALSTGGLALAGLYRIRALLILAAVGVHTTRNVVLRAL